MDPQLLFKKDGEAKIPQQEPYGLLDNFPVESLGYPETIIPI